MGDNTSDPTSCICRVDILRASIARSAGAEELLFTFVRQDLLRAAYVIRSVNDREDLVQQALITIHRKFRDRVADPTMWTDYQQFRYWCHRILLNHVRNYCRMERRTALLAHVECDKLCSPAPWPDACCLMSERRTVFWKAMMSLTSEQRRVLSLQLMSRKCWNSTGERDAHYAKIYRVRKKLINALAKAGWPVSRHAQRGAKGSQTGSARGV